MAAIDSASSNDVVLIAGKGHEDYQEIAGVRHPFSDRLIVQEILNQQNNGSAG
jgi:UDP-N-acetylmuramoyl-L-alanyl-D-glutamate--2,6-diaminopimelate ligase